MTQPRVAIWRVLTGHLENPVLSGISLPLFANAIYRPQLSVPAMNETVQRKRWGKAFQSVLTQHFDFIREQRQRRKTWREIAESLAAERGMPHAYTEEQLVEQPAIGLFVELGWATGLRVCGCQPARRMAE